MKAAGSPLVGKIGGGVFDEELVATLADGCDNTEERENTTRKTDICISSPKLGVANIVKHYGR